MDNIYEVLQAVGISFFVITFLLNTSRVVQAIDLCKECSILLNNPVSNKASKNLKVSIIRMYQCIYFQMFNGYLLMNDCTNAIEYIRKLLVLLRESGERDMNEGKLTLILAKLHQKQFQYQEAKERFTEALSIMKDTGDREGEAACYWNLGNVFWSLGEYAKSKEYHEKALVIATKIGDRGHEALCYQNLGSMFLSLGEYDQAKEYLETALVIAKEICDRKGEASCYINLGSVFWSLGGYAKAKEYSEKALAIAKEIGDRETEASCYGNLGAALASVGEYVKAKENEEKALAISKEIGDRETEASCHVNLGAVFEFLGEYSKATEYFETALTMTIEIGNRLKEATCYRNLGSMFWSLGGYAKAKEYHEKALAIAKEIGHREIETSCYSNLGVVFESLGEHDKAKEYIEKALTMTIEIGNRAKEATCYGNLGAVFTSVGEFAKAKEYHEKALVMSIEIGDIDFEKVIHTNFAMTMLKEGNIHEAKSHLLASIDKFEKIRSSLADNDQFKISLFDGHVDVHHWLSFLFCATKNPTQALYVVELGRARALADLLSAQYSVKKQISVHDPQTWTGIENIMKNESNCTCLYISYFAKNIYLWILKGNKPIRFRKIDVNACFVNKASKRSVDEVLGSKTFRQLHILAEGQCEDRSWFPSNVNHPTRKSSQKDNLAASRLVEEEEDENQQPDPTLAEGYQMIIAPVADLLDEEEIIIVPDRSLFKVPFAALEDESGKYLSQTFRIRIVPSLTTLKLIHDSPADYHSQTGALIVGDPDVGEVFYKGTRAKIPPLSCAREEAEMIGGLLRVHPLLGQQATKQAVLESIGSVSLIHFAAHGDAERGEIVLAPPSLTNRIPQEDDYLLTMADISKVRLRAKLVVLSCCHSANGQIRAEGVVGIARAFLGSGACSVLVALWSIEDRATKQFMSRFYKDLVNGESASESLHQAMKWMRNNGFSKVGQWAPFLLIGDNVTFDFGN